MSARERRGAIGAACIAAVAFAAGVASADPIDYDCLLGGADTARVTADGTVTLTRRGVETARGHAALPMPFDGEAGGVACRVDRLTVFMAAPDGRATLVTMRLVGAALVPMDAPTDGAPDGAALCKAGRHAQGAVLLRAEAEAAGAAADPWLRLGDCLWDGGAKGEAREAYLVYSRRAPQRTWPAALARRCPECDPKP